MVHIAIVANVMYNFYVINCVSFLFYASVCKFRLYQIEKCRHIFDEYFIDIVQGVSQLEGHSECTYF